MSNRIDIVMRVRVSSLILLAPAEHLAAVRRRLLPAAHVAVDAAGAGTLTRFPFCCSPAGWNSEHHFLGEMADVHRSAAACDFARTVPSSEESILCHPMQCAIFFALFFNFYVKTYGRRAANVHLKKIE